MFLALFIYTQDMLPWSSFFVVNRAVYGHERVSKKEPHTIHIFRVIELKMSSIYRMNAYMPPYPSPI